MNASRRLGGDKDKLQVLFASRATDGYLPDTTARAYRIHTIIVTGSSREGQPIKRPALGRIVCAFGSSDNHWPSILTDYHDSL